MLVRGIRSNSGSVASAMLTALLRSRLGFFGRVGFLDPFQLRGNYPPAWNCLNPSRERKRAVSPGPATKVVKTQSRRSTRTTLRKCLRGDLDLRGGVAGVGP